MENSLGLLTNEIARLSGSHTYAISTPGIFADQRIGSCPRPFSWTPAKHSLTLFDGASVPHSIFGEMPISEAVAAPLRKSPQAHVPTGSSAVAYLEIALFLEKNA